LTPELYEQIGQIYHAALELAPENRSVFLDQACDGNEEMRREVERMLASNDRAGSFLATPAAALVADLLVEERRESLAGRRLSHYKILSPIGAGGMGEVFLAQDTSLERRVALKLLPVEFTRDRDRMRRFEQEAKAASALNHPNIVTIYEIGQTETEAGSLHFIAQEFIEGQTLRHRTREGKLPMSDALDIAIQAANALQVAHATGIVHRDIKPENIMLRPDGFIKILDFGLAKLIQQRPGVAGADSEAPTIVRTMPGTILGTTVYMSPEQARGLDVDARVDIWSLGVVLYEMLTGRTPFRGATMTDVIVSIIDHEPQPISQSLGKTPPELERIVMKTLAKNRDERYQTIRDFAIDLKNLKHRLEFDAELARFSKPETTNEAPAAQSQAEGGAPRPKAMPVPTTAASQNIILSRAALLVIILLIAAASVFFAWSSLRPKSSTPTAPTAPERQISYSLTIQKMRDDKPYQAPFEATGQEIFENGWKFKLNFSSPQPGYLYLLNEGPTSGGAISFSLLFPFPSINSGSAQIAAGKRVQTGWYVLSEHQGTERLWLVWAAQPVGWLEAVKGVVNPNDKGTISDPHQLNDVRALLNQGAQAVPEAVKDKVKEQTNVRGRGETLIHLVELKHR